MVHKAGIVSFGARIDDPVLVYGEHIEVSDVVLMGIFDSRHALLLVNQLSNILVHKFSLSDVPLGHQAPTFAICLDDLGLGVLALGETLVLAVFACRTHLRVALKHQHPVQTLRIKATRILICGLTVALRDFRNISCIDLDFPIRLIHLDMLVWRGLALILLCFSGFPLKFDFTKSSFSFLQCVFEDSSDPSDPLVAAAPVPLHVREHSRLMRPVIIFRPKEKHRELSNLVLQVLNIWGDIFGMANFCRPPSVVAELHPDDVLEVQPLPCPAVIAEPAAIRHVDVQAVRVEGGWAGLAA